MHNVFRVFIRDLKRIAKAPASWVVLGALMLLPSLYTWFNVVGFWNPYENTGALKVCVVNEDAGAYNETLGQLELGDQIVDTLHENTQLGWTFVTREEAMSMISSGEAYAAFVIPEDFSQDMTTIISSEFTAPKLEYYVNEKLNPVAPKITDTGASTLENTINDTFVSTVSSTIAEKLNDAIDESSTNMDTSKTKVVENIDIVEADLAEADDAIAALTTASSEAIAKSNEAKESLSQARRQIGDMALALSQASALVGTVNTELGKFSASASTAMDKGSSLISSSASQTNVIIAQTAGNVMMAQGNVKSAISYGQNVVDGNKSILKSLQQLADDSSLTDDQKQLVNTLITTLSTTNSNTEATLSSLSTLSDNISESASSIAGASNEANSAVQTSLKNIDAYRQTASETTIPQVSSGLASIATTVGNMSGTVTAQTSLIDQTSAVLDQLADTFSTTQSALQQTSSLLDDVRSDLDNVRTDVVALSTSTALGELFGEDGHIDVDKVADFMKSPTEVETQQLYPLNSYGTAMSPLFINLTLWIGVFMLMVIMHLEVDDEGIKNLRIWQRYLGRGILLAIMVAVQAAICITGCLFLGVQTVNAPALYLTAIACSLTYLAIQYTLSTCLQHLGKGLCVVLVFVQIPGATGLYPVELTTSFFQAVYPVFPFTYGINAMRECICGFYEGQWWNFMGMLGVYFVIFLAIGVFARPYLSNLNRMFARQLAESDMVNCETVQLPERRFRLTQIVHAMSDHEEFRQYVNDGQARFMRMYPILKHGAYALGIVVPVVFTLSMAFLSPGKKVVMLTAWLIWFVLVLGFLIVLEFIRDNFNRQVSLEHMSDEELHKLYVERNKGAHRGHDSLFASSTATDATVAAAASYGEDAMFAANAPQYDGDAQEGVEGFEGASGHAGVVAADTSDEGACAADADEACEAVDGAVEDTCTINGQAPADTFDLEDGSANKRGRKRGRGGAR